MTIQNRDILKNHNNNVTIDFKINSDSIKTINKLKE